MLQGQMDVEISPLNLIAKSSRMQWFRSTIKEYNKRRLNNVVEIGSMRRRGTADMDGFTTLAWALWCKDVITVDIDPDCKDYWDERFGDQFPHVKHMTADAIEFGTAYPGEIDLLVLDAWDGEQPDSVDKHLEAYNVLKSKVSENGLILIDDMFPKGIKVVPQAIEDGFQVVFAEYMVLLSR